MKKLILVATLSLFGLIMVGCSQSSSNQAGSSSQDTSSSEQKKEKVEYSGMVKEDGSKEEQHLLLNSLTQAQENESISSFDEVILLTEGVSILDKKTQEERSIEDIKAGSTITVFLVPEPITTRSLPPQIPGNSIVNILINE